jgi:hypothetical protein
MGCLAGGSAAPQPIGGKQAKVFRIEKLTLEEAMNTRMIAVAVAVVLVIGGGMAYRGSNAPEQSLGQIKKALEKNDMVLFEQHFDIETFSYSLVDGIVDGVDAFKTPEGRAVLRKIRPTLAGEIGEGITDYVRRGSVEHLTRSELVGLWTEFAASPTLFRPERWASGFGGVDRSRKIGNAVIVDMRIIEPGLDDPVILSLELEKVAGKWRVTKIDNYADYISQVDSAQDAKLAQLNAIAEAEMLARISYGGVKTELVMSSAGIVGEMLGYNPTATHIVYELTNTGDLPITRVASRVVGLESRGDFVATSTTRLGPGEAVRQRRSLDRVIRQAGPVRLLPLEMVLETPSGPRTIRAHRDFNEYLESLND